ncbi:MAG: DUF4445 domain-containing protein [Deltaproteobacteria bacterium]|nr:DUF4445 domain-containing protein [Deltaproteobacteria bacterium]
MPENEKLHISFSPVGKSVNVSNGSSVLDAARKAGINITSDCGGHGKCGQCRIMIHKGDVSPLNVRERTLLSEKDIDDEYRLACQCKPSSDLKVFIPETSLLNNMRLQLEGNAYRIEVDQIIKSCDLQMDSPTLKDSSADMNRAVDLLKEQYGYKDLTADIGAVKQLPGIMRRHGYEARAFIRYNEIIGFGSKDAVPLGFAVDLGTTKIAAFLMDLTTGKELASTGSINPQAAYGDDLMSRLDYAIHHAGRENAGLCRLSQLIRETFNRMIMELTEKAGCPRTDIADICVVGNTAMTHLFLDLPVGQLAKSPYVAATNLSMDIRARDLGLSACPGAYVHILPGIGGFVGADHVAMILAGGIEQKDITTLGVDIGTNTEIVMWRPDKSMLVSLSCPSGPAFEGAHVTDGMRAANGAIESVKLTKDGVEYKTIGDAPAIGLCGSGIIDAIAELYRWKIIGDRGRFDRENKRVSQGRNGSSFRLTETGKNGNGIVISQKDVAEIQLAKGAINAGIEALLEVTGTSPDMVEEVIIAGAFGSYIDLVNTINIGLLPYFKNAAYKQVGNSAIVGAKMALVSATERKRSQNIAASARYLELTTHHNFSQQFARGMRFPVEKLIVNNKNKQERIEK